MITTRPIQGPDHKSILAVAESLPEWFDADARGRAIPADLRHQPGFLAELNGDTVGFVTLFFADGRLNIGWLGVRRDHRREGIGAELLVAAEEFGRSNGVTEIATYTLGPGVDYEPYAATRQFYFNQGFKVYQISKTDSPGCPEEIRIRKDIARHAGPQDRESAGALSPSVTEPLGASG